jgi:aminoglycoside/choline kinase family phosphotransferase
VITKFSSPKKCANQSVNYAPKIIETDLVQGFLLLEDLGNVTFLQALNENNRINLYKKAINELIKIQKIDYQNKDLPLYDNVLLTNEMQLLIDWYLPQKKANPSPLLLTDIFQLLSDNAQNSPQVFVHRDYHARNLMVIKEKIALALSKGLGIFLVSGIIRSPLPAAKIIAFIKIPSK